MSNKRSKKILRKRLIEESNCGPFITDESSSSIDRIEFKKRDSSQNKKNEIVPIRQLSKKFKKGSRKSDIDEEIKQNDDNSS